ncbi:hypothetical protein [Fusobacterium polymorphum]|nr:hypothetical protein [Fusobacterium polymorphum]PHI16602.1 hypothetical protein CBG58_06125 [Fusobacterium polymorphum]
MVYYRMFRKTIFNNVLYDNIVDVIICVSIGIIYYYIEPKITKRLEFLMKKLIKNQINLIIS